MRWKSSLIKAALMGAAAFVATVSTDLQQVVAPTVAAILVFLGEELRDLIKATAAKLAQEF